MDFVFAIAQYSKQAWWDHDTILIHVIFLALQSYHRNCTGVISDGILLNEQVLTQVLNLILIYTPSVSSLHEKPLCLLLCQFKQHIFFDVFPFLGRVISLWLSHSTLYIIITALITLYCDVGSFSITNAWVACEMDSLIHLFFFF